MLTTNLALQGLLLVTGPGLATFLSQLLNVVLGFVLYGKHVFRVEKFRKKSVLAYSMLALTLWACNWGGIYMLISLGFASNIAALTMIPALAAFSYTVQRCFVFTR